MNVGSAPSLRIRRWPHARPLAAFLLALSAILGVPAGQALAIFHIGLTKATSGHSGVTMTVEEAETYSQPDSTHWGLTRTQGYMDTTSNGHWLICDRSFIYANNTVLVGSKQSGDFPFPIYNADGLVSDYFTWSISLRSYPLEAFWEADDYSPDGVNCGYGGGVIETKPSQAGSWSTTETHP